MATSNLLERIEKLEEILAAVGYEFGELGLPPAISDQDTAKLLSSLWSLAESELAGAEEAMGDLVAIVASRDEMTAAAATRSDASNGGVDAEG